MRLRGKILAVLAVLFVILSGTSLVIQRRFVLEEFERIEDAKASDDLGRCSEAYAREIEYVFVKARDWAFWDDTYAFIADRNEAYSTSNMKDEAYKTSDFHLLYFVDRDGHVIWGGIRDTDFTTPVELSSFPKDRLPADHEILTARDAAGEPFELRTTLITERGPLLCGAAPIMTSEGKGPARGWLVIGRFLSEEAVAKLGTQTKVDMAIHVLADADSSERAKSAGMHLEATDIVRLEHETDERTLAFGHAPHSKGRVMIEARIPRDISRQGSAAVRLTMVLWVALAAFSGLLLIGTLHRMVIGPLHFVARSAAEIGRTGDLSRRIGLVQTDEIGLLAGEFDAMLGNLKDLRTRLLEASRQAGMADVATGVLHHAAGALNSLNVSVDCLASDVRNSKGAGLTRVVGLLTAHRDDLARFLTEDEKGRNVPRYLDELSKMLAAEHADLLSKLNGIKGEVEHVSNTVAAQEAYTHRGSFEAPTSIKDLVETALETVRPRLAAEGVEVRSDLVELPTAMLDGGKITRIVVGLLLQSRKSFVRFTGESKHVEVRLRKSSGAAVVTIMGNGGGLSPEALARELNPNATAGTARGELTLHDAINLSREMDGDIEIEGEGQGEGSRFKLRVPLRIAKPEPAV